MASSRQHLKTLERRRDHLARQLDEQMEEERRGGRAPNPFIERELEALTWALDYLEPMVAVQSVLT